ETDIKEKDTKRRQKNKYKHGTGKSVKPKSKKGKIVTTSRYVVPTGRVKVPAGRYVVTTSRYVVPTGRVKVPAGRYVVPTGKDKFIVSAGRTKVIPAGSTILVLVVLCLLWVDSKS
ncbi:hypothetical protein Tco_1115822, partial [Tanacetum coccineum]